MENLTNEALEAPRDFENFSALNCIDLSSPDILNSVSLLKQIAYFVEPNHDCLVECLPTCQSLENPPKFPPIKCETYMLQRYNDTHAALESYEK